VGLLCSRQAEKEAFRVCSSAILRRGGSTNLSGLAFQGIPKRASSQAGFGLTGGLSRGNKKANRVNGWLLGVTGLLLGLKRQASQALASSALSC